jgi:hypothetical protein
LPKTFFLLPQNRILLFYTIEDSDNENEEAFLLNLLISAAFPEDPEGGVGVMIRVTS